MGSVWGRLLVWNCFSYITALNQLSLLMNANSFALGNWPFLHSALIQFFTFFFSKCCHVFELIGLSEVW